MAGRAKTDAQAAAAAGRPTHCVQGVAALLLCVLLSLLVCNSALALPEELRFQRLGRKQGLSQSSILCAVQDGQGFLWFGTYDGLNRYDGYEFKVYRKKDGDPGSLTDNVVRALSVDSSGGLWVGTDGGGLLRYDRASDTFQRLRHDPDDPQSISSDEIFSLHHDSKGTLWVGTSKGLDAMAPGGGFVHYRHDPARLDSLLGSTVWAIAEDNQGRLWVGTDKGLNRLSPDGKGFSRLQHNPHNPFSIPPGAIRALQPERGGGLWIGSGESGLGRLDVADRHCRRYLPGTRIMQLFKDSRGILWAGTEKGLARRVYKRDPLSGDLRERFLLYQHNPFDSTSLSHNDVYSLLEDASGLLWIGTYSDGLCKLDPMFQEFRLLRREPWKQQTLSGKRVRSVLQDKNGDLWLGTTYGGLNRVDPGSGEVTVYRPDQDAPQSFPAVEIRSLALDQDGSIWVGSAGEGVIHLDTRSGRWKQYDHDPQNPDDPYSLSHDNVYFIYDDGKGSLWVGMSKAGLNRLDKRSGRVTRYRAAPDEQDGLSHDRVRTILEHGGYLWLGTNKGLNRFNPASGNFKHWSHDPMEPFSVSDDRVTALLPGPDENTLWVGTHKGLNLFDMQKEQFKRFTSDQGYHFSSESVVGMLQDDLGRLWISSFAGLSRFDPPSGEVRNYSPEDGLQGYEFLDNSVFRNSRGELFFGGINGLTWFDPDRIRPNTHVPPVVVTDIRVMNRSLQSERNVTMLESLALEHDQDFFAFTFAALDFVNPEKNSYAYKLEGFDKEWVQTGNAHTATYTSIAPGTYTFRVRAANNDGYWNDDGLRIRLDIMPPFWGRTWFQGLAALLVLLGLWFIYWLRVRRIKRQQQQLEAEVEARTSELERTFGQLDALMNYSPSAIALKDGQGRYTMVNPQFTRFFKAHGEGVVHKTDMELFDNDTASLLAAVDQSVWHSGEARTFELRFGGRTFMMQRFALRDEQNAPYAICGIATDISERKETEDALKASEARYRALTANFPEGLVGLFDRSLCFSLVDGAELAGLGLSKQGVQGRTIYEIFPPDVSSLLESAFREALSGKANRLDLQYMGRDLELRTLPITNDRGEVLAGMIVAHNVTARKEAEKARIESEQIYRSIAELSPDAIFVHGACGILFANRAAASMLGEESVRKLTGRSMLTLVQDKEKPTLQELFDLAMQSRQPTHLAEVQLVASDGALLQVEMATVPIVFMEDPALLTIGRDITEKKRLMAETMRAAQLASLGELAAGVAHEINNPINGIINFAELIRDDANTQLTYKDLPQRIIKEGERIASIVRTLLSFSKGQEEGVTIASLEDVLTDAMRLSQNQLEKDGIQISLEVQEKLPKVHGRPSELQQVCINLLSNARSAINSRHGDDTSGKRLEITLDTVLWKETPMVRMVFADNGMGIEPHVLERMFEPFYSTKPRNEGTGLGLSISHRIIQDHGGRIYYESEPGSHTRAIVEVPAWAPSRERSGA